MLKDKIKQDSVSALKNHDSNRVEVLRFLVSLIDKKELQLPPGLMTEAEEINVLRKELKNKEESKTMFANAGRGELVTQVDYEIGVVKEYLPAEMTEDELRKIVGEIVAEKGVVFGLVMKEVMTKVAGRLGGEVVSRIVKEEISNVSNF